MARRESAPLVVGEFVVEVVVVTIMVPDDVEVVDVAVVDVVTGSAGSVVVEADDASAVTDVGAREDLGVGIGTRTPGFLFSGCLCTK